MITVIQRVTRGEVTIDTRSVGKIGRGIVALVAVEKNDTVQQAERLAERVLSYRIFPDATGRMNLSVRDINGDLLLVPQFTLAADTGKGTRPGFEPAASPELGKKLFASFEQFTRGRHPHVACGHFGADMKVALVNDGPVTFILRASPSGSPPRQK